jgi:hypothetical protein
MKTGHAVVIWSALDVVLTTGKVKFTLEQAMMAQTGSRVIALLFL